MSLYIGVHVRCTITHHEEEALLDYLRYAGNEMLGRELPAELLLTFIQMSIRNSSFDLECEQDRLLLAIVSQRFDYQREARERNAAADPEEPDDPQYGLVPEKPVFTRGVRASYVYLEGLETEDGRALEWTRRGSMPVEGQNGMIDIYSCTLPDGETYGTVYVNMYGNASSTRAPRGYRRRD